MLKRPEIALGFLTATVFWIAVLGWATSYSPSQQEKNTCYQAAEKTGHGYEECKTFWERTTSDPIATFTLVLAISTIGLWVATLGLYIAGERHSERQLRAYITGPTSARISDFQTSQYPAVILTFKNSGQTPAQDVCVWTSSAVAVYPMENPPARPDGAAGEGSSVGTIGPHAEFHNQIQADIAVTAAERAEVIAGGAAFFVYGEISYRDSFGKSRTTTFCHFYAGPTARTSNGLLATYHKWNRAT